MLHKNEPSQSNYLSLEELYVNIALFKKVLKKKNISVKLIRLSLRSDSKTTKIITYNTNSFPFTIPQNNMIFRFYSIHRKLLTFYHATSYETLAVKEPSSEIRVIGRSERKRSWYGCLGVISFTPLTFQYLMHLIG